MPGRDGKLSLEDADKLQNELRRAYETKEFQAKLQHLLETTPGFTERMQAYKELIWVEQASILPKYGFEANQKGNLCMMVELQPFNDNPTIIRNVTKLNKALRMDEISEGLARFTKSCEDGVAATQQQVQKGIATVSSWRSEGLYLEVLSGGSGSPLVLSAPHDGRVAPAGIPDRVGFGTWGCDQKSMDLAIAIRSSFPAGLHPALIINKLARRKLDANRPCCDGVALNNRAAFVAWAQYHNAVSQELRRTVRRHGFALLLDIHGQTHRKATELGYLLNSRDLLDSAEELQGKVSSVDAVLRRHPGDCSLDALVRGGTSMGALLEKRGFECTPSPREPHPVPADVMRDAVERGVEPPRFYAGNYTARRYGAPSTVAEQDNPLPERDQEEWAMKVAAIQLETESRIRDAGPCTDAFAVALRETVLEFLAAHCGWTPGDAA